MQGQKIRGFRISPQPKLQNRLGFSRYSRVGESVSVNQDSADKTAPGPSQQDPFPRARPIDFAPGRASLPRMTATLEQTQADLARLLELVRRGEDVVITQQGQPVARLTAVPEPGPALQAPGDRARWLAELAELRRDGSTGKTGATTEAILDDLREERGA